MESRTKTKSESLLVKFEKAKEAIRKEQDHYCQLVEKGKRQNNCL